MKNKKLQEQKMKLTPQQIIGEIAFWLIVITLISIGVYALFFM